MAQAIIRPDTTRPSLYIALATIVVGTLTLWSSNHSGYQTPYVTTFSTSSFEVVTADNVNFSEETFGDYSFQRCLNGANSGYFRLLKNGEEIYREESDLADFSLVPLSGGEKLAVPLINGAPNLVIAEGRMDNLKNYHVLELGSKAKEVALIVGAPADLELADLNHAKNFHLVGRGDVFETWGHQPVTTSLVYDFMPGKKQIHLAKLSPDNDQLQMMAMENRKLFAGLVRAEDVPLTFAPAELAECMAQLIYQGNAKKANWLLDESWPQNLNGKAEFKKAFYEEISQGSHWSEVKALNKL